jgi:hydroxyacylglutathione hydrolase
VLITGFAAEDGESNCYLVAARRGADAIVIDPGEDAVPTLEYYCAANDLNLAAVLLTHGHRDHAASAWDVCAGWEIPVHVHPADRDLLIDPPEILLDVPDRLTLAELDITVEHTPGHTPGSVAYRLVADTDEGPVPVVFTGDTLGHRTVGHPTCGDTTEDPAGLRESIAARLLVLADDTVVLPGHGPSTTIGDERRFNRHLRDEQHP